MAVHNDIKVFRGEDVTLDFTLKTVPSGGIAAWTLHIWIREKLDPESTLIYDGAGNVVNPTTGNFEFPIPGIDPGTLVEPRIYYYDAWRTNSGAKAVLSEGKWEIKPVVRE